MPGARDGQLRIHRGADEPPWALQMFDDDLGLWLTLAEADEEAEMVRAGIPILRGPYVVDYTDIPHEGDKVTLWTPAVGDVLLRLSCDWQSVVQWDSGTLYIGQGVAVSPFGDSKLNVMTEGDPGVIGRQGFHALDNIPDAGGGAAFDASGQPFGATIFIFHTTDPVQIQLAQTGGTDPTQGHVALYALVARAAPP